MARRCERMFFSAAAERSRVPLLATQAVYEFGQAGKMAQLPAEFVASIGGSTGVRAAAKAVQAAVRLGKMMKDNQKENGGMAA